MDVAIVAAARFAISEPFAGGMEAHTHALADGLAGRGHDVTVYAAGGAGRFAVETMLPVAFQATDRARRDVSDGPGSALAEHHSYLDAVLRLCRARHQLVHVNAVHHLPFACSPLIPSVVSGTLHSPPTPWLESALALAARQANPPKLASVSRSNAAAWHDAAVTRVIVNGVDPRVWRFGPGGPGAVWSGRIVPEKAPHLAIDAARLAGVALRLIGPVHDDGYFRDFVIPRLGDGVEYVGHLVTAEAAAIVRHSAVAVVTPTWEEPFGLVVAEALSCGTPVAGFARGALPELVDTTSGVLAEPGDVAGLAVAMLEAASLRRLNCRARAEHMFSAVAMVDAYEAWFDSSSDIVASCRGDEDALRPFGTGPRRRRSPGRTTLDVSPARCVREPVDAVRATRAERRVEVWRDICRDTDWSSTACRSGPWRRSWTDTSMKAAGVSKSQSRTIEVVRWSFARARAEPAPQRPLSPTDTAASPAGAGQMLTTGIHGVHAALGRASEIADASSAYPSTTTTRRPHGHQEVTIHC